MNGNICHREDELLDALGNGYVGPELDAHVLSCTSCSELRLVAGSLLHDHREAVIEAHIPSAGAMLWRMHARARREAAATAGRSLLIGQAATLAVALTLVIAFFGSDLRFFGLDLTAGVRELVATIRLSTPLLLAFAVIVLTAPIAGWVAVRQK